MIIYDFITQGQLGQENETYIPVASTSVVYTKHIPVYSNDPSFSFEYKAESDANVALKIEVEQANQPPAIEYTADENWCIPDDALEFNNSLTDELVHIKSYPPAPTRFMRMKITGLTGNDASVKLTRLTAYVMR